MMKVSVTIPVFNQVQLTERCLHSLLAHSSLVTEVFVIDNASRDSTAEALNRFQAKFSEAKVKFQVIRNPENVGFGRACNQGVREFLRGSNPYLVILNNDTWLMKGWDQALVQSLQSHQLDCVGPYFYEKPLSDSIAVTAAEFVQRNRNGIRRHFVPILMCFTRSAVTRLASDCAGSNGGIFDERFFVTYEDTDLVHRMQQLRMNFGQTGSCFIWHHSKGTRDKLPSGYEQEGLRLFQEKWGFDPRKKEHTLFARLRRRYWTILDRMGLF